MPLKNKNNKNNKNNSRRRKVRQPPYIPKFKLSHVPNAWHVAYVDDTHHEITIGPISALQSLKLWHDYPDFPFIVQHEIYTSNGWKHLDQCKKMNDYLSSMKGWAVSSIRTENKKLNTSLSNSLHLF